MKKVLSIVAVSLLSLTGCGSNPAKTTATPAQPTVAATNAPVQTYECDNGLTAYVKHINRDQIELSVQNHKAILSLTPSASGSRYVAEQGLFGYGGQWHSKGQEAHFSYVGMHGNAGQAICRTTS